ncbi:MAG: hypothetical protein AB7O66_04375 [Limisphaerales bacterium]
MPSNFVPLVPGAGKSGNPGQPGAAATPRPAFTPMRPHAAGSCAKESGNGTAPAREPVVTLHKDGEHVTGIRIECGCGQVIELACTY